MSAKPAANLPPASRRQVLILGGLFAVLGVLVLVQVLPMFGSGGAGSGAPSSPPPAAASAPAPAPENAAPAPGGAAGGRRGAANASAKGGPVEEVALAKLQQPWPEPTTSRRNPFTMTAEPPPPPPPGPPPKPVDPVAEQVPTGPPPPPPIPPITLKFIGTVTGPSNVGKIAALTDGKFVYKGKEGQVVEGRYRIVKIGEESIQIEYANGTGRQTIRLSGK
jgi:hypothetical protein